MRRRYLLLLVAGALAIGLLLVARWSGIFIPAPPEPRAVDLEPLRRENADLHARLEKALERDPIATKVLDSDDQIVVAMRTTLVQDFFRVVARRYLDQVFVDLSSMRIDADGELRKRTLLGTMAVGHWKVELTMDDVKGTLRALAPEVRCARDNTIHLALPVDLQESRGSVTAHFTWSSEGVVKAVCHDFSLTRSLSGRVLPAHYSVAGMFQLSADADQVVARPHFPAHKFPLHVDLTPESWAEVRQALASQHSLDRCVVMDPDKVEAHLRELASRGFMVKLPDALFRTVRLPAAVEPQVTINDRPIALSIRTKDLQVTPETFWSGAAVHVLDHPAERGGR
jgi:hypothetical protein